MSLTRINSGAITDGTISSTDIDSGALKTVGGVSILGSGDISINEISTNTTTPTLTISQSGTGSALEVKTAAGAPVLTADSDKAVYISSQLYVGADKTGGTQIRGFSTDQWGNSEFWGNGHNLVIGESGAAQYLQIKGGTGNWLGAQLKLTTPLTTQNFSNIEASNSAIAFYIENGTYPNTTSIRFLTPNGAGISTRYTIGTDGQWGIGNSNQYGVSGTPNYGTSGQVFTSEGPTAAASWSSLKTVGGNSLLGSGDVSVSVISGAQLLTTNTTLTASSPAINSLQFTATGGYVTLPNATTMTTGGSKFVFDNRDGTNPVGIITSAGKVLGQVIEGESCTLHLIDNTSADGDWKHTGELDPIWMNNDIGINIDSIGNNTPSIYRIDDTRYLIVYKKSNGFLYMRLVTWSSVSSVPVVSSENLIQGSTGNSIYTILPIDSNRCAITTVYGTVTVLDTSTNTVGTATSITMTNIGSPEFRMLDSRYGIAYGRDNAGAPYYFRARCIDFGTSGTTVTVGADNNVSFSSLTMYEISSGGSMLVDANTYGFVLYSTSNGYVIHKLVTVQRTTGTTITVGMSTTPDQYRTSDTTSNYSYMYKVASDKILLYYSSNTAIRYVIGTFTATPSWGVSVQSNIANTNPSTYQFRVSASQNMQKIVAANFTSGSPIYVEALSISGTTITVGTSTQVHTGNLNSQNGGDIAISNSGTGLVWWRSADAPYLDTQRTFSISGTTFTFGTVNSPANNAGFSAHYGSGIQISHYGRAQNGLDGYYIAYTSRNTSSLYKSRNIVFTVNTDRTINIVARLDVDSSSVNPYSFINSSSLGAKIVAISERTESIVIIPSKKRLKRSKSYEENLYGPAGNIGNGWDVPYLGYSIGLIIYPFGGYNCRLVTYRPADL